LVDRFPASPFTSEGGGSAEPGVVPFLMRLCLTFAIVYYVNYLFAFLPALKTAVNNDILLINTV